jgi:uncharacterized protein YqjF (DUF2071 family)
METVSTGENDSVSADEIDTESTDRAGSARPVMYQLWRKLSFLHWKVDPESLIKLIPDSLELDRFDGSAYVGLVPFTMRGVRPAYAPAIPPLSNFHETNVRTYVRYRGGDPGVWFFSLDAANAIAVGIARAWFKLPYYYAKMHVSKIDREDSLESTFEGTTIAYDSTRLNPFGARCSVATIPYGPVRRAERDSLDHFLIERYVLYATRGGSLYRGRVRHSPYPIRSARVERCEETLIAAAGIDRPAGSPPIVHYSSGVDVTIDPLELVRRVE